MVRDLVKIKVASVSTSTSFKNTMGSAIIRLITKSKVDGNTVTSLFSLGVKSLAPGHRTA